MEARAGIEPACEDLQSSTSPLRHRAELERGFASIGFRCQAMIDAWRFALRAIKRPSKQ